MAPPPKHRIHLVERQDGGRIANAKFCQQRLHRLHLLGGVVVGDVDHVHKQVGVGQLFQRGAESGDELGGQLLNQAHGVRQQHRLAAGQGDAARGWIERGKQLVLGQDIGARSRR